MRLSPQSWQDLVDALDMGVLVTDEKRKIRYANRASLAVVSQRSVQAVGVRLDALLPELSDLFNRAQSLRIGETAWRPITIKLADGASPLFHAKVSRRVAKESDEPIEFVVMLMRMTDELMAGMNPKRSVGALMPTFLHELKNPLAAIATSVELLLEDLPAGELRDELLAIFGEIRRMKLVLDGVGLVGKPLRTRGHFNVQTAMREACTVLQPLAKRKGVMFNASIGNFGPLPFDAAVLKAILFNLVMNAIHASSEGQAITVTAIVEGNIFRVAVEDTGMGMSPETLEQCTRLFYTTKPFGSGIGLALCIEVAREAGGELAIESTLGEGTTVIFDVPIDRRGGSRA